MFRYTNTYLRKKLSSTPNSTQFSAPVNALFTIPIVQTQSNLNGTISSDLLGDKCAKSVLVLTRWLKADADLKRKIHAGLKNHSGNTHQPVTKQMDLIAHELHQLIHFKSAQSGFEDKFNLVKGFSILFLYFKVSFLSVLKNVVKILLIL